MVQEYHWLILFWREAVITEWYRGIIDYPLYCREAAITEWYRSIIDYPLYWREKVIAEWYRSIIDYPLYWREALWIQNGTWVSLITSYIEWRHCEYRMVQEYHWLPLILKGESDRRMVQEYHRLPLILKGGTVNTEWYMSIIDYLLYWMEALWVQNGTGVSLITPYIKRGALWLQNGTEVSLITSNIEWKHCDYRMILEYHWLPLMLKGGSDYRMVQGYHWLIWKPYLIWSKLFG